MIFSQRSIEAILNGTKTETRRRILPDERHIGFRPGTHYRNCIVKQNPDGSVKRLKWKVGDTYAVQPGRGQHQVARIRILELAAEDVRKISDKSAHREGYHTNIGFLNTWCGFHDSSIRSKFPPKMTVFDFIDLIYTRPADRYHAWILRFVLADVSPEWSDYVNSPSLVRRGGQGVR